MPYARCFEVKFCVDETAFEEWKGQLTVVLEINDHHIKRLVIKEPIKHPHSPKMEVTLYVQFRERKSAINIADYLLLEDKLHLVKPCVYLSIRHHFQSLYFVDEE